jgi:hypothetical protein
VALSGLSAGRLLNAPARLTAMIRNLLFGSELTELYCSRVDSKAGGAFEVEKPGNFAMLAIASFIIHSLGWQAGNEFGSFALDSDYPLTGLLPRNAPNGISSP